MIQPIIWISILLIWAIITKSQKRRKKLLISTLIVFLFFSNQFIFNEVSRVWEGQIPSQIHPNDQFEVAIVLGGISNYDEVRKQQAFHANSERLVNILPLYFNGKVQKILFSGGSGQLTNKKIEAVFIRDYLLSIGVNDEDILIDTKSRNTFENVKYSLELLNDKSIEGNVLLSTSATHMNRSLACFNKLGFEATPFPVDYVSVANREFTFDHLFLPHPSILDDWYWLFHEWLGIASYKMMGYC